MSLRDRLKRTIEAQLHVAPPRQCNSATQPGITQQPVQHACNDDAPPIGDGLTDLATDSATQVQQASCTKLVAGVYELCGEHVEVAEAHEPSAPKAWPVLLAMGLDDERAEGLTAWLRSREVEGDDGRLCVECWHFGQRGKVCRHPRLVAIGAPRDLGWQATTPLRCQGFKRSEAAEADLAEFLEALDAF
jgi:hypothetical protein